MACPQAGHRSVDGRSARVDVMGDSNASFLSTRRTSGVRTRPATKRRIGLSELAWSLLRKPGGALRTRVFATLRPPRGQALLSSAGCSLPVQEARHRVQQCPAGDRKQAQSPRYPVLRGPLTNRFGHQLLDSSKRMDGTSPGGGGSFVAAPLAVKTHGGDTTALTGNKAVFTRNRTGP